MNYIDIIYIFLINLFQQKKEQREMKKDLYVLAELSAILPGIETEHLLN